MDIPPPRRWDGTTVGLIVDWAGFTVLLAISACFYGLALVLLLTMVEPRRAENTLPRLSGELSKNQAQ